MRRFLALTLLLLLAPLRGKAGEPFDPDCKMGRDLAAVEKLSGELHAIWGAADPDASYGELAVSRLPPLYRQVLARLSDFKAETLPHDPRAVTQVRKAVLALRRSVDLFAYAYPERPIGALRDDLDEGYAVLGRFKELSDAQAHREGRRYREEELARRREAVLAWKESFTERETVARTRALLMAPGPVDGERSRKSLGVFAWGGVKSRASAELTGLANVRRLVRASLEVAREEYQQAVALEDPLGKSRRERFHDFKKRTRSIFYLLSDFPELVGNRAIEEGRLLLFETEERYGAIIDELVALDEATVAGKTREAARMEARIRADWVKLQAWQRKVDLDRRLKLLKQEI